MARTRILLISLLFTLCALAQGWAQTAPEGLSIDDDFSPGDAGYYYVNMPGCGHPRITIEDPGIVFKVYDDGGKNGNYTYSGWCSGDIQFYAPEGYVFEVSVSVTEIDGEDQLAVIDGDADGNDLYLSDYGSSPKEFGPVETTGNGMFVLFDTQAGVQLAGFELTVRMKPNAHLHNIAIDQQAGAMWTADAGSTAIATRDVILAYAPEANRVQTSVKVVKTGDAATEIPLTKIDDTHYRFTMPDFDVTVVPGPNEWEWTSGNTVCRLDNQGVFTVRAIAGTDGAMADYSSPTDRPWSDIYSAESSPVEKIVVERGVTVIGKYAFHSGNITSATLPAGLLSIHQHAFRYCNKLTEITIPYSVVDIAAEAFYSCYSLANVYSEARASSINWGRNTGDFDSDPSGVDPGPFTKMHVFPSQVADYEKKRLNVSVVGDLEASGNWTDPGNYAESFSQQDGKTITITNEAELARLAYLVNKEQARFIDYTFYLARDLNMASHDWSPIGTGSPIKGQNSFKGVFDGQGHTIYGIVVNRSGSSYNGLFGYVGDEDASSFYHIDEVKNVQLKESRITGGEYTGGLVGYLYWANLTNSFTDAEVNGTKYVGGLVGGMDASLALKRYARVTGSLYMGSQVSGGQSNVRAVVGYRQAHDYCVIQSYYTNKDLSAKTEYDVYAVKASDETSDDITVTFGENGKVVYEGVAYYATDGSTSFTVQATDPYRPLSSVVVNDDEISTKAGTFSFEICSEADVCRINAMLGDAQLAGSGTESDPYRIANMDDWNLFAELVTGGATFSGKFVKQMDQIGDQNGNPFNGITTMVGESEEHSFQGTFDGGMYYLISSINSTADYAAPFRYVKNATIKNMKVAGTFDVGRHGSALVGRTYGTTLIDSIWIHSAASISSSRDNDRFFGGVVGHGGNSTLTMKNILFEADMTNDGDYTGGLLGWTDGMTLSLDSCTFRGSFSGNGAFHPIAVRMPYAAMSTSARNVYFYTGPKNIDNGHIAVSAIRVQNSVPTDGSYGTAVDALTGNRTCYYYNDAPQGLHIDYDKERGTPGYYFVNMPCDENQDHQLAIGSDVASVTVYDDGGKLGKACDYNWGTKLALVAPRDKILEVQGRVVGLDPWGDYLSLDDDAGHNLFHFGNEEADYDDNIPETANIASATTAGHVLFIFTENHEYDENGFELQVTLQSDGKYHFGAVTIESDLSKAVIDGAYSGDEETVIPRTYCAQEVVLDRDFTVGAFSTIMLPFTMTGGIDLTKVHGAEFYGFSEMNYEDGKWTAGATKLSGHIPANTPYLVKPTATRISFDGDVCLSTVMGGVGKTTQGDWEFQGTYENLVFGDVKEANPQNTYYGFTAQELNGYSVGQFAKAGDRAYIYPMRAYLVHNGANGSQKNAGGFGEFGTLPETIDLKIMDENGVVTETATLNTRTGEILRDRWFDLQGRKLNGKPAEKGKYLHNGKVEIVR